MVNIINKFSEDKGSIIGDFIGGVKTNKVTSTTIKPAPVIGDNVLTDPIFANWQNEAFPDNFELEMSYYFGGSTFPLLGAYAVKETVEVNTGDFAIKSKSDDFFGNTYLHRQSFTGLTPTDPYRVKVSGKYETTAGSMSLILLTDIEDEVWNFTTTSWDAILSFDDITADHISTSATTDTYSQLTFPTFTVPTSGSFRVLVGQAWGTASQVIYYDDLIVEDTATSTNICLNGGFETWVDSEVVFPTSFGVDWRGGFTAQSEDAFEGSYALLSMSEESDEAVYIAPTKTGLTSGDTYTPVITAKKEALDSSHTLGILFLRTDISQLWNPTTKAWISFPESDIFAYAIEMVVNANTYTEYTTTEYVEIPADGSVVMLIGHFYDGEFAPDTEYNLYIGKIELKKVTGLEAKTIHEFANESDIANITATDETFSLKLKNGESDFVALGQDGEGTLLTDFNETGFKVPLNVECSTDPEEIKITHALNNFAADRLLGEPEIDLKIEEITMLTTGKSGYRILLDDIISELIENISLNYDADISIGTNSPYYNNIVLNVTYTDGPFRKQLADTGWDYPNVGEAIYIKVNSADTGTSGKIKIYIKGMVI